MEPGHSKLGQLIEMEKKNVGCFTGHFDGTGKGEWVMSLTQIVLLVLLFGSACFFVGFLLWILL